ncbi:MAG: CoA-transferase [Acidobacteriota bacterium]|jgi:acyl CoA:acetate/3-ketoacid CoA transferase alpha subunit/acyl CoA:acetate/3-ketoacid CoA transferase beta subunit
MAIPKEQGKLLGLQEAVKRYVQPGMKLHLAGGIGGPSAVICEIIRQYWGKHPEFTLIEATVTGHALNLVHSGLVKKLICSVCAEISGTGRPSKVIQDAYEGKRIELENWSLNSLQQRLMAGAFGVPFMPTRSVVGSSIAADNKSSFKTVEDPFGSGAKVGVASALLPDISVVHGCAADPEGNTILQAPYGEDLWGAMASKGGVVVTTEKIVSSEFIKRYAALVKIPSYAVNAVVHVPLGLHPFSLTNPGITDIDPYERDVDFLNVLYEASTNKHSMDEWIGEWVLRCENHQQYLAKLGDKRVADLRGKSRRAKGDSMTVPQNPPDTNGEFEPKEMMLIALAREILSSVERHGHKLILAGAGVAATAAFLAHYQLKSAGFELGTGNGQIGYTPIPGESILASEAGVRSSKMLTDTVMMQGVFVGGGNNKCMSVLGAGQVDRHGNINSTKTSKGKFLVGSGGANDALNAREVILCLDQSRDRFVEKLSYITGSGNAVTTVVSTMGIFRKSSPQDELQLLACFPKLHEQSLEERIKEIRNHCGWDLKIALVVEEVPRPSGEELHLLRWLKT